MPSVYAVFTAILIYQVYHCLPQGMQAYISRYISTKFARKLIEWVTSADQTQQTIKDRVVYYRYEGEENTGIQDKRESSMTKGLLNLVYHIGIIELPQYTT